MPLTKANFIAMMRLPAQGNRPKDNGPSILPQ
jgi:hypothetical protein